MTPRFLMREAVRSTVKVASPSFCSSVSLRPWAIVHFWARAREGAVEFAGGDVLQETEDRGAHEATEGGVVGREVVACGAGGFVGVARGGGDEVGIVEALPFFEEAGVDTADEFAEVVFQFDDLFGLRVLGDGWAENFPDLSAVAEEEALGAFEAVVFHVVGERAVTCEHFARDGFGADGFV